MPFRIAEIIPLVTVGVPSYPKAYPTANTSEPTTRLEIESVSILLKFSLQQILIKAKSRLLSRYKISPTYFSESLTIISITS